MITTARRVLSEGTAADFSIRRLAEMLEVAPATLFARFGTKQEVLALAYLHELLEAEEKFQAIEGDLTFDEILHIVAPTLSALRTDFALRFEIEGGPMPGVRSETWDALGEAHRTLVRTVWLLLRDASARDGLSLMGGSLAERLVWSLLSSGTDERNAVVYGHQNSSYFRFLAKAIKTALGAPARS